MRTNRNTKYRHVVCRMPEPVYKTLVKVKTRGVSLQDFLLTWIEQETEAIDESGLDPVIHGHLKRVQSRFAREATK